METSKKLLVAGIGIITYISGVTFSMPASYEIWDLNSLEKKNKLVEKTRLFKEMIPLMKEPYANQYSDTLVHFESKIKKLESKIENTQEDGQKKVKNAFLYSWGAFFVD